MFPATCILEGMKLFIASDLHGAFGRAEKIIAAFRAENADLLLLCGDYLNHGPRNGLPDDYAPEKVAPLLSSFKEIIIGVRGNCDSEVDQLLLPFPMMGDYAVVFANARRLFLTHGHIHSPEKLPQLPAGSVFVSGHTHVPVLEYSGEILLVNPGSPAMPKGGSKAGYALVTAEAACLKTLEGETVKETKLR